MKAVVKIAAGEGNVALKDWPEPSPAPDEIELRIGSAGICGTDLHIIKGSWACQTPVVIGHEFCGTVVQVGSRVKTFKPGDRVVGSNPARTCGMCYHCRAGNPFMCSSRVSAGYMIDGAFAEYFCIAAERCHALPAQVTFRQAALGEPLAVAVRAVMAGRHVADGGALAGFFVHGDAGHGAVVGGLRRLRLRCCGGILRGLLFGSDYDFESFLLMRGNRRHQNRDQKQRAEEYSCFRCDFYRRTTPRHCKSPWLSREAAHFPRAVNQARVRMAAQTSCE